MKKDFKATEDYLIEATIAYQAILGLKHMNFEFVFDEELDGRESYRGNGSAQVLTVNPNYPYLNPQIRWGKLAVDIHKEKRLERHLIHELIHCITRPLYEIAGSRVITIEDLNNTDERITDHIANIIYGLVERARKYEDR